MLLDCGNLNSDREAFLSSSFRSHFCQTVPLFFRSSWRSRWTCSGFWSTSGVRGTTSSRRRSSTSSSTTHSSKPFRLSLVNCSNRLLALLSPMVASLQGRRKAAALKRENCSQKINPSHAICEQKYKFRGLKKIAQKKWAVAWIEPSTLLVIRQLPHHCISPLVSLSPSRQKLLAPNFYQMCLAIMLGEEIN